MYHSTLGLRVIHKKKKVHAHATTHQRGLHRLCFRPSERWRERRERGARERGEREEREGRERGERKRGERERGDRERGEKEAREDLDTRPPETSAVVPGAESERVTGRP